MPVRIHGAIPPEIWNRLGTRLLPKLRSGRDLRVGVTFELTAGGTGTDPFLADLRQILDDLQLADRIRIDVDRAEDPDTGRKRSVDSPPGIAAGSWPSRKRSRLNCDLSTHGPRSLLGRPEDALSQNGRD